MTSQTLRDEFDRRRMGSAWPWRPAVLMCAVLLAAGVRSAEAGINVWTSQGPPSPNGALAIDPSTRGTLYAGTDSGVFKSTDGGGTWISANRGAPYHVAALAIDPVTTTTLYAGGNRGVCLSALVLAGRVQALRPAAPRTAGTLAAAGVPDPTILHDRAVSPATSDPERRSQPT